MVKHKTKDTKFMVLYIGVESGEIIEVYSAHKVPVEPDDLTPCGLEEAVKVVVEDKKPFPIKDYHSDKCYTTFYAETNPW